MFYTINSSPMPVTKSVFKLIFVLSNYQTCTFPLKPDPFHSLKSLVVFIITSSKRIQPHVKHRLVPFFTSNQFCCLDKYSNSGTDNQVDLFSYVIALSGEKAGKSDLFINCSDNCKCWCSDARCLLCFVFFLFFLLKTSTLASLPIVFTLTVNDVQN